MSVNKKLNFISRQIEVNERLVQAYLDYLEMRTEYDALDYGNTLTDGDIAGDVAHVTKADLVAAFVSLANIQAVMSAGNLTNFLKLRR